MLTEINWSITVYTSTGVAFNGALSTIDLSFPEKFIARLAEQYGKCSIRVKDSRGKMWECSYGE